MNLIKRQYSIIQKDLYALLKLAIPMAFTGMVGAAPAFFETLFLAHVDQTTLAAGALVSWLYGVFVVILFGILSAINVLIAHQHGAQNKMNVSHVMRDGLYIAILLTIPAFLLFWNMAPIFTLFGQKPYVVTLSQLYLHALSWGLFPCFISIVLLEFLIGLGKTRALTFFTVLGVLLVVCFSYMLIFGKWGFPALGIAGAGWGMTIAYWMITIILVIFLFMHKEYKPYLYGIFKRNKPFFIWELLRVGTPMGVMYCIEVAFFFSLTLLMGSLGSQTLAANQIALQYMGAFMTIIFSIAQAITVRMGHLLGAEDGKAAKIAGYLGVVISGIFMCVIAIFYGLFPMVLISADMDVHNPNNIVIVNEIKKLFAISAIFQIFEAMRIALFGVLRALKDTKYTLLISFVSFWCIALPLGYALEIYGRLGGQGLWWGMTVGALISVALLYRRMQSKMAPDQLQ
jgi:MATE family multidrug resistance protein